MGNVGFGLMITLDILLIFVIGVIVVGTSVADNMRKVRNDAVAVYLDNKTKLKEKQAEAEKKIDAKSAAEKAEAEARANELKKLNEELNAEQVKAELKAREEIMAEEIKAANDDVIVAPGKVKEKYTFDPQFSLEYFNGDGTRAYNDEENETKFREKFEALISDGVQF